MSAYLERMSDAERDAEREPIMRFFDATAFIPTGETWEDSSRLRGIFDNFQSLAERMHDMLPKGPEKSVALRKLLEARDAALRAGWA